MSARRLLLTTAYIALLTPGLAFIEDALDIIKFTKEIGEEVYNTWETFGHNITGDDEVSLPFTRRKERLVLTRLAEISRSIQRLELSVDKVGVIVSLLARKNRGPRLELKLNEMADLLARVSDANNIMRMYMNKQNEFEMATLEDFARWCVSYNPGALSGLLSRIHALVVPPHNHLLGHGIMKLVLLDLEEDRPEICELQMSQHQLIYDLYNTVALTEIKGYAMMQFSWMLLRIYGKGNFTQEASLTRQRYGERASKTATAARSALAMARRDLYRCDPPMHVEGETYAQVTKLLQGYIENEVDMNPDGTCRDNCAAYTLTKSHGCFKDLFCSHQPKCKGRIINCQYIDSDMWICLANKNSSKRYDWIEYENGRILGKQDRCDRNVMKVDSWWRYLFWHCSYCMCICDDANNSDRFFSMRDVTSNVSENKVVTGVRLIKESRVFHLQVSEATLGERGALTGESWVPVQKFDPLYDDVTEGVDFHTLTYEHRAIDLDELDSPDGHILTGVRFRMLGSHLHFEIQSTAFNYTTGKLSPEHSMWISNDNTDATLGKPRSELVLVQPDIPTRSIVSLPVDSNHDQYVEFTHSDFAADAAQSTVPFVDIQPVSSNKGLVSGAGIYHRGAKGTGGFIGVKLFTYNFTKHVKSEIPQSNIKDQEITSDFVPTVN